MLKKHPGLVLLALVALGLAARIIYVGGGRKEIVGSFPVKKLESFNHYLHVYPMENTNLSDFIDMEIFDGFAPGITFEEATAKFGNPNNVRREKTATYYEYWNDLGRIEIGLEKYADADGIQSDYALWAYPKNTAYFSLLSPEISKYINADSKETSLAIFGLAGEVSVSIYVRGARVEHIIWHRRFVR